MRSDALRGHGPLRRAASGNFATFWEQLPRSGLRRGVPIVVFSVTVLGLAWPTLREAMRRWRMHEALARVAVSLCFIVGVFELSISGARFASGAWRVPLDCDFTVLPGKTMPETYRYLLAHPDAVDHNYEPERTWTVLHFLSRNARDDDTFSHAAIAKRLQR